MVAIGKLSSNDTHINNEPKQDLDGMCELQLEIIKMELVAFFSKRKVVKE